MSQDDPTAVLFKGIAAVLGSAVLMTLVLGVWMHWLYIIGGIVVSLWAAQAMTKGSK